MFLVGERTRYTPDGHDQHPACFGLPRRGCASRASALAEAGNMAALFDSASQSQPPRAATTIHPGIAARIPRWCPRL